MTVYIADGVGGAKPPVIPGICRIQTIDDPRQIV